MQTKVKNQRNFTKSNNNNHLLKSHKCASDI